MIRQWGRFEWVLLVLIFIVILIMCLMGCQGQVGRSLEQGTAKLIDVGDELIGAPGSDIFNFKFGSGILGAIIVGAMFIQAVRSINNYKKIAGVLSSAVKEKGSGGLRKAIGEEMERKGVSKVKMGRFRKKVGTE